MPENLVVNDNQTRQIVLLESDKILDELRLGVNSTITFAPDVTHWNVTARLARFGEGSKINARGLDGGDGANGGPGHSTNTPGKYGDVGESGKSGVRGARGVDVTLTVTTIESFGGAEIDASGGKGGNGGDGGRGGKSGDARCPSTRGRNGQQGGASGRGGDGGDGGAIHIRYRDGSSKFSDPHEDVSIGEFRLDGINLISYGGGFGRHGTPGQGGLPSAGKDCFPLPNLGGGKAGGPGAAAVSGTTGANGPIVVEKVS